MKRRLRSKTTVVAQQIPLVGLDSSRDEDETARRRVYLVTFPHPRTATSRDGQTLVAPGSFTREQLFDVFRDACTHPAYVDPRSIQNPTAVALDRVGVWYELHKPDDSGQAYLHAHIGVVALTAFRYLPVKRALLSRHGLATHWSCSHEGYHSIVAYLSWPSEKKCEASLDCEPFLWANGRPHPPLEECRHEPNTAKAIRKKRDYVEKRAAEDGQSAPRVSEMDVYALVASVTMEPLT